MSKYDPYAPLRDKKSQMSNVELQPLDHFLTGNTRKGRLTSICVADF
jgi:hypothetical protein